MGGALVKEERFLNEDEKQERLARNARLIPIPAWRAKVFEPNEKFPGQDWKAMNVLSRGLNLDLQVINQMYSLFCMADLDKGGSIDLLEFCYFLRVENSKFNQRLFQVFDADKSGQVDFLEFVCAIWNLATWPQEDLASLMFHIYDQDNSGFLERSECERLIIDVFDARKVKFEAELLLESLDEITEQGVYSVERRVYYEPFLAWCDDHKEILHPLLCMYHITRNRVLGAEYWNNIGTQNREKVLMQLEDIFKSTLGPPLADQAVQRSLSKMEQKREKDLQRKQHEALFHGENEEDGTNAFLKKSLEETEYRVFAANELRKERSKRYSEYDKTLKRIMAQGDPLSVLLRFSNRSFEKDMRDILESAWRTATESLQSKTYDRPGRLANLVGDKPGKADQYFMRKNPKLLSGEDRDDSNVHYSSAVGKLTWVEHKLASKESRRRDFILADGNRHLAVNQERFSREECDSPQQDQGSVEWADQRRARLLREKQREEAIFQENITNTTRQLAKTFKNQYMMQNVKRPTREWKERTWRWLKEDAQGEHHTKWPKHGRKPWRPRLKDRSKKLG